MEPETIPDGDVVGRVGLGRALARGCGQAPFVSARGALHCVARFHRAPC